MSQTPKISVVVPVYNGQKTIGKLVDQLIQHLGGHSPEIVLVDDDSKDGSWQEIERLKGVYPDQVVGIQLQTNSGQHNATICGLSFATGELVATMDDDLRHQPEHLPLLLEKQASTQAELVYAIEKQYAGSATRAAASKLVQQSTKRFSQHGFVGGSSFRLMTRALVDKLKANRGTTVFIDEVVHWYTTSIELVEVDNAPVTSKSRYSFLKLFRLYTQVVHNYAVWPLKAMILVGSVSSVITFLLGALFIYRRFALDVSVPGFTATIVTILFSTSLIMLSLGVIGLYIFKLYHIQSGKPSYVVRQVI